MYTDRAAMVRKFGELEVVALTDRTSYTNQIDDEVLSQAIISVTAEIDSYLASRYTTPLNPVPAVLQNLACDMVRYYLTGSITQETNAIKTRYDSAIKFLKAAASGEVTLGGMPNAGVAPTVANTVVMTTGGRVFERSNW